MGRDALSTAPAHATARTLAVGTFWTTAGQVVASVAGLAGTVVAARLVPPSEFGRMGIVTLVLAAIEAFTQSGFEQALVQRRDSVDELLDVAWTWTVLRGLFIGALMCAAAPLLAHVYDDPLLVPVLCVSALAPVLRGAANVGVILYRRNLDFRAVFMVNVGAPVFRLAALLAAAILLRNVWALVIGAVAEAFALLVASYVQHPLRPRFRWSWERLRPLVRYGRWVTAMSILGFLVLKGDDLFVSKALGYEALAFYQLAFGIASLPASNITQVVSRVSFPAYARLQADPVELRRAFVQVMRATTLLALPVATFLGTAAFLVPVVVGERWAPVVPLVQLLMIGGMLRSFLALGGALFLGTGRPDLDVWMNLPRLVVLAILIAPFSWWWQVDGVALASIASVAACFPVWIYGVRKQIGLGMAEVLRANALALVASTLLGLVVVGASRIVVSSDVQATALAVASVPAWLGLMWILGRVTPLRLFDELQALRTVLRKPAPTERPEPTGSSSGG
ncbi:MAG: lipopolysaccharide biosynthesis protein [Deltaproteobacteria bacterium]|nr:lipopolysaccharide biosynthesis protein [Deltaproteobacteria bacterium]